ncbi:hypothetical protein GCM10018962_82110 [Dactylosporangium matsuzakiense]|uniref:Uncharacterized protein n=2 Tax=Dactylosporangium matsuzakiense TaxID=53360 RepID=A0A9W6NIT4_9ACTN|nr:hypothetical protein GCM10017581_000280 [Dactylosporangium matsuzakiense]
MAADRGRGTLPDMDGDGAPKRASFGLSMLVALGWYVTVIAANYAGHSQIPTAPVRDCGEIFSCLSPAQELMLLLLFAGPLLAALLLCTAGLSLLFARLVPSSVLAGSAAAAGSVAVVVVGALVWGATR